MLEVIFFFGGGGCVQVVTKGKIVVEKSTVPVRTAHAVATVLANNDKGLKFQVGSLSRTLRGRWGM